MGRYKCSTLLTMRLLGIILHYILFYKAETYSEDTEYVQFCADLDCDSQGTDPVCGFKPDGAGFRLKIFKNECTLMEQGCKANASQAYGIINLEYCKKSFPAYFNVKVELKPIVETNPCNECLGTSTGSICALRRDGVGFKVKLFAQKCEMIKYNCLHKDFDQFNETDAFLCDDLVDTQDPEIDITTEAFVEELISDDNDTKAGFSFEEDSETLRNALDHTEDSTAEGTAETVDRELASESADDIVESRQINTRKEMSDIKKTKNLIVFHGSMFGYNGDVNETMNKIIAATHLYKLPIKEVTPDIPEETRRIMRVAIAEPIKVFKPWIVIPKNVSDPKYQDDWHSPTLSSCYHKCPLSCPQTYAPVCGTPGVYSREPALMFQNHCFMDATQCKIRWEDASPTADIASYIESSFIMCLGDTLSSVFRFLPLVRTLQHMGRLKRKGVFKYKFKNLRFFNNILNQEPKLMGK